MFWEVLTAVLLRIHFFWGVMVCHWMTGACTFEAIWCFDLCSSSNLRIIKNLRIMSVCPLQVQCRFLYSVDAED